MTETKDIENLVIDIVAEHLNVEKEKVDVDSRIVDDLGADSLDQVELVMALEEEFDIEISDEIAEKIITVSDIIKNIQDIQKEA